MRIRTYLGILAAFGLGAALISLFFRNGALLESEFELWGDRVLPFWMVVLLAFFIGVLVAMGVAVADRSRLAIERFRRRRGERSRLALEEKYLEGVAARVEGRPEEALRRFREVLDEDPQHLASLLRAGELLRERGRGEEALEMHRRAREVRPDDTRPLHALVDDHEALGDLAEARKMLATLIEMRPRGALSAFRRLRALEVREGNWEAALDAHRKVESLGEKHGVDVGADRQLGLGIRYQLAAASLEDGKAKAATVILRRLVREAPDFVPAWLRLGEAQTEAGNEDEAVETWNRGFETTGSPVLLSALEDFHLDREQPLEAIAALKRCAARSRRDLLARFYLGKLHFRLEMLDEAWNVLSELRSRASYAPSLHYLLGRIAERRGDHAAAAESFRKSLGESRLLDVGFRCRECNGSSDSWQDRCAECGTWNAVEADLREAISPEELGLSTAPVYTAS